MTLSFSIQMRAAHYNCRSNATFEHRAVVAGGTVTSDWLWVVVAMIAALATVMPVPMDWLLQLLLFGLLLAELVRGKALSFLQGYGPWIADRDTMPGRYWSSIAFLAVMIAISIWRSQAA